MGKKVRGSGKKQEAGGRRQEAGKKEVGKKERRKVTISET